MPSCLLPERKAQERSVSEGGQWSHPGWIAFQQQSLHDEQGSGGQGHADHSPWQSQGPLKKPDAPAIVRKCLRNASAGAICAVCRATVKSGLLKKKN